MDLVLLVLIPLVVWFITGNLTTAFLVFFICLAIAVFVNARGSNGGL